MLSCFAGGIAYSILDKLANVSYIGWKVVHSNPKPKGWHEEVHRRIHGYRSIGVQR
jgi:hypothetical protein